MTLDATSFLASFDITDKTQELDISPILLAALMVDTGVLGQVPMSAEGVYDVVHYWNEIALNDQFVTLNNGGTVGAADTSCVVSSAGIIRKGALLKPVDTAPGTAEIIQVTAVSGTTLTISRGYGGTTATTHADGSTLTIIGMPLQEASDIQTDVTKVPSVGTNYTQIFERSITISRNQMKRRMAAIHDFLAQSLHDRTMELKRELELALIHSVKSGSNPAGTDSVYRSFDGLLALITNAVSTSEAMSSTVFDTQVKNLIDNGAADAQSKLVLVAPTVIRQTISGFQASNRRLVESDVKVGHYVEQIVSDLGPVVDVVTSNYLGAGAASPWTSILLDTSRCSLKPFADDTFKLMAATDWVDGIKRRVLGEYTVELRNGSKAHYVHTGLSG